jgi:hypothetical protein
MGTVRWAATRSTAEVLFMLCSSTSGGRIQSIETGLGLSARLVGAVSRPANSLFDIVRKKATRRFWRRIEGSCRQAEKMVTRGGDSRLPRLQALRHEGAAATPHNAPDGLVAGPCYGREIHRVTRAGASHSMGGPSRERAAWAPAAGSTRSGSIAGPWRPRRTCRLARAPGVARAASTTHRVRQG